jgi:putative ABC transport system substrate-binding protein
MIRRREFITLLGGAAAWPLAARAQQPAIPVVGFLNSFSADGFTEFIRGFRQGLKETGFVEGENVTIEYRWADGQLDRLPALAAELVSRRVAVIATGGGGVTAFAAKAATTAIPIVFLTGDDPVSLGLVANLSRPDGNMTGVNFFTIELAAKRLELLRQMVPTAARIAVLVNPANVKTAETTVNALKTAAATMGVQIQLFSASTSRAIDTAFDNMARERPDALFVGTGPPFTNRRVQLVLQAMRQGLPAMYGARNYADAGGLMSYGASLTDSYRQVGVYTGRILKGAKPFDLPVLQSTKFELVINAQTARMLGLTVPPTLLVAADEVIE